MVDYNQTLQDNIVDIKDAFGKYIVAPIAQFGLGGFVFDIEGSSDIILGTEITDHFTESNTTIQDHIAIRPKRIRLDTYVGELVYYGDPTSQNFVQRLSRKLTVINSYLPLLTQGTQQAKNILTASKGSLSFNDIKDTALNLYSIVKNFIPPTTKQQQAYQYFKALMEQKILLSVQTPFEFCTNMAIENIFAIQDAESRMISNFSITLKEIRFVSTGLVSTAQGVRIADGRAALQNETEVNGGKMQGQRLPVADLAGF